MTKCRSTYQPYPVYSVILTGKNLPLHLGYRPKIPGCILDMIMSGKRPDTPPGTMKPKLIQTMFRESEAQTDPYVVDLAGGIRKDLEILTLNWLSWNNGLPAGINETQTIERARQRKAWESALPLPLSKTAKDTRSMIIEAIEINEWKYREELIAAVGSLRMMLAEKLMKDKCEEFRRKYENRLKTYMNLKKKEKTKNLQKLRLNFNRDMRKLTFAKQKVNKKYFRRNIIEQFTNKTSELYAPQLRFGEDPRHWNERINTRCGYWKAFKKLEIMHHTMADIPEPLKPAFDFSEEAKPRQRKKELCVRSTKWTEQNLEILHDELQKIRKQRYATSKSCHLKRKFHVQGYEIEMPSVMGIPDEEEDLFQACLFLQKTIKGRAIQAIMFEGRVKCQELIEELKSTHALQNDMEDIKAQMRKKVYSLQRQAEINEIQEKRKNEILCALEGKTTGEILDFLAKELLRLQNERATHVMALLADQERHKREAAEAGRRQLEEQRRREHDEMFKQIMKMHQNTVHAFLENVLIENKLWLANREAREYATKKAQEIDEAAKQTVLIPIFSRSDYIKEEEIIADLVHNFALPEAEKIIVRKKINDKQRNYLKICHDEVYTNMEKVVHGPRSETGKLLPLPMVGKHKIPPLVRVKYMHLKRMHESSSSTLESKSTQNSGSSIVNQHLSSENFSKLNLTQPQLDKELWSSGFSRQDVILEADPNDA